MSESQEDEVAIPSQTHESHQEAQLHTDSRLYYAFAALAILTLMAAVDATSLSIALPAISKSLGGSAIEAFWAGTSFLLCSTVFQPNFAAFSHIFGRKPVILIAITFFFIGAIIGGVSHNFTTLLVGRSIQGVGGGGIIALTEIVVTDLIPLRSRGKWFGVLSAMWSLGSVCGPIIGGAFVDKTSWRWLFYINFPFIAIATVMVIVFLQLNHIDSTWRTKLGRVDWLGSVICVSSLTSFLIPLTWGGVMYSWSSWHTVVPLVIGSFGLLGFVLYEKFCAKEQLIRLRLFRTRTAITSYVGTTLHGLILWCGLYYLPLYFEGVRGFSAIISGVAILPVTFTVAPAATIVGLVITWTGSYRAIIWIGWALSTLGIGLFYLMDVHTVYVSWIFIMGVAGLGLGALFPSLAFAVQGSVEDSDLGFAIAMFSFFRALGQTIGIAVGGVVFQNRMRMELQTYPKLAPLADTYSKDASALVEILKNMSDGVDKENIRQAYADSLKTVWVVCCACAGVGLISSLRTKHYSLDRTLVTEQGFRHGLKAELELRSRLTSDEELVEHTIKTES